MIFAKNLQNFRKKHIVEGTNIKNSMYRSFNNFIVNRSLS